MRLASGGHVSREDGYDPADLGHGAGLEEEQDSASPIARPPSSVILMTFPLPRLQRLCGVDVVHTGLRRDTWTSE